MELLISDKGWGVASILISAIMNMWVESEVHSSSEVGNERCL